MPAQHNTNAVKEKDGEEILWAGSSHHTPYLPLGIDVSDFRCLVVGGGRVALRKVETLLNCGAGVTVAAPEAREEIKDYAIQHKIKWLKGKYRPGLATGYDLIIAATSDKALNIKIGCDAGRLGKLHCVVSSVPNSQIIFPAVHKRGSLTVAVHSNGENCRYSKAIRNRIATFMGDRHAGPCTTVMFGFDQSSFDIGHKALHALHSYGKELLGNNPAPDEFLILSTCCRWECYLSGRQARHISREILAGVKKRLSSHRRNDLIGRIRYRAGSGLYFHLLKTCLGLNSYLYGETEIVHQVRTALHSWVKSESSELHETFSSALAAAKKIRHSTALDSGRSTWADKILELTDKVTGGPGESPVLVVGKGDLTGEVIPQLIAAGYGVVNFSRHGAGRCASGSEAGAILHTDRLGEHLEAASALIICSELTSLAAEALTRCQTSELPIIDLEGYAGPLDEKELNAKVYSVADVARRTISPQESGKIASANYHAFRQALIWQSIQEPVKAPVGVIRLGARKSSLSQIQVREVRQLLEAFAGNIDLAEGFFDTPCDRDRETPLTQVIEDDFFTRDIDLALLSGEIDLAVHSAKDLPARIHGQLATAAVLPSMATWDCLVSRDSVSLTGLPEGAAVATSSDRRRANLARLRPDLRPVDVRGNVPDRLEQLDKGRFDALIVAAAAMIRLGLSEKITEVFPGEIFPPAAGQGSLALLVRRNDAELLEFLKPLDLAVREG